MKTIRLTKDIPHEGLVEGDVIAVDDNSAAALIRREQATEYDPEAAAADTADDNVEVIEPVAYGEQEDVRTIDDIRDPQAARNARVMTFTTVAQADPGPAAPAVATADTVAEAESTGDEVPAADDASTGSPVTSEPAATRSKRAGRTTAASNTGTDTSPEVAASDAQSAGGDAGGGTA